MNKILVFRLKSVIVWALIFASSSCSEFFNSVVEIDLPPPEPRLVLFSVMIEGDKEANAIVTKIRSSLDSRIDLFQKVDTIWINKILNQYFLSYGSSIYDTVNNVDLVLWKNDTPYARLERTDRPGIYNALLAAPLLFEPGTVYTFKASAPGYPTIEASQKLPFPVKIDSISLRKDVTVTDPTDPTSAEKKDELGVAFKDPATEQNAYYYNAFFGAPNQTLQELYSDSFDPRSRFQMLSDESFNGKHTIWKIHKQTNYPSNVPSLRVYIDLITLSPELYEYRQSVNIYDNAQGNPFAEPVILYTNITNGYGCFGMASIRRDSLDIK